LISSVPRRDDVGPAAAGGSGGRNVPKLGRALQAAYVPKNWPNRTISSAEWPTTRLYHGRPQKTSAEKRNTKGMNLRGCTKNRPQGLMAADLWFHPGRRKAVEKEER
jgi:hypothetical protein